MATVYITEFSAQAQDLRGFHIQAPAQPPVAEQTVAIGAGSVQSAALNDKTTIIRVHADAVCSIAVGVNPTATAVKARMAAGQTEYFAVPRQSGFKVAVITNT